MQITLDIRLPRSQELTVKRNPSTLVSRFAGRQFHLFRFKRQPSFRTILPSSPAMMDSHADHLPRPTSPSGSRHLMMPPFQSIPPPDHFSASDIPSTNKPSSISVITTALYSPDGSSSTSSLFAGFFPVLAHKTRVHRE